MNLEKPLPLRTGALAVSDWLSIGPECKQAVVDLYGTDPKSNSDYSRIVTPSAVKRLASMIDPTKVVSGGKFDESARYPDPTILYPVSWSDKVMQDEVFGPILPTLTYSDLGKLLAKIKSLPKPLAGYLFSRNQQTIDQVLRSLSFGGGAVNQIPAQRGHRSLVSALHHGKGGSSQPVV